MGVRIVFSGLDTLPFRKIYAIDFEFYGKDGEIPQIVCMVTQDLRFGEVNRYWREDLYKMKTPPFETGGDIALVSYFAPAEVQSILALGWDVDVSVIDLFAEFRCQTNGDPGVGQKSLVNALQFYGLDHLIPTEKDSMRDLILSGGPWSKAQRSAILDYCQQDVVALGPLFDAMLNRAPWSELQLNHALLRGRYMTAVGAMQKRGIPIDLNLLDKLSANWGAIKLKLIKAVDTQYGVYVGGSFKAALFEMFLTREGIAWPRLGSGRVDLKRDTFKAMSKTHPIIQPIHQLRKTLAELKLNKLAVGRDGRNRASLRPLGSKTGRNQPSTTKFIFGPAKWVRGLIKPEKGMAIAYCDWSSQEIAIAAALSGDQRLWEAYSSGDPYIAFAVAAGLAPDGATKETHKNVRNRCKPVVLGTNYGMSAYGVAQAAQISELEAKALLQKHYETYYEFWNWAENNKEAGLLGLKLETCFGWSIQVTAGDVKANTFLNWPIQAHGAEMLRIACILAVESGIKLCAPIHDALLIEAPADQIDAEVVRLKDCMFEASEAVLGDGKVCRVDADIVRYPDRYMDEHGKQMWNQIMGLLAQIEG